MICELEIVRTPLECFFPKEDMAGEASEGDLTGYVLSLDAFDA